jgi:hypothetical protein
MCTLEAWFDALRRITVCLLKDEDAVGGEAAVGMCALNKAMIGFGSRRWQRQW